MSRSPSSRREENRSLYIRAVPFDTRVDDLRAVFSKYGIVKDVYIPRDFYSRKPRGFAYVEFDRARDAENAMNSSGRIRLFGKDLEIEFAQGDRKTPNEMRTRFSDKDQNDRGFYRRNDRSPRFRGRSRSRQRNFSKSRSRSISRERRRSVTPEFSRNRKRVYNRGDEPRSYRKNSDMMNGVLNTFDKN